LDDREGKDDDEEDEDDSEEGKPFDVLRTFGRRLLRACGLSPGATV